MTSKHEGFEEFRDLEPVCHEKIDQEFYEGVVEHACFTSMGEMVAIGKASQVVEMLIDIIGKERKEIGNVGKREGHADSTIQSESSPDH